MPQINVEFDEPTMRSINRLAGKLSIKPARTGVVTSCVVGCDTEPTSAPSASSAASKPRRSDGNAQSHRARPGPRDHPARADRRRRARGRISGWLCDCFARRRLLYPRPLSTAPSLLVIDIAEETRSESLALGRYYPIVLETDDELEELEAFLAKERDDIAVPDLLDWRPFQLVSSEVLVCRYDPQVPGWP
jgi:hypothetical protein